jgi:hypothetical protein
MSVNLTELWVRVIETMISGVAFGSIASVCVYVALHKEAGHKGTLALLAVAFGLMSLSSFATSVGIYTQHLTMVAWFNGPSCLVKAVLAVMVVGNAPMVAYVWVTWSKLARAAPDGVQHLEIVAVEVQPVKASMRTRWRRARS